MLCSWWICQFHCFLLDHCEAPTAFCNILSRNVRPGIPRRMLSLVITLMQILHDFNFSKTTKIESLSCEASQCVAEKGVLT